MVPNTAPSLIYDGFTSGLHVGTINSTQAELGNKNAVTYNLKETNIKKHNMCKFKKKQKTETNSIGFVESQVSRIPTLQFFVLPP